MASLRDEAEVLALGLELGVVRPAEVVDWADGVIARTDHPHWSIGELVTMGRAYEQDVADALRRIPGEPDRTAAMRALLLQLPRRLRERRDRADGFVHALLYFEDTGVLLDADLRDATDIAWDSLGQEGRPGYPPTRDQIIDELLAALDAAVARLEGPR